MGQKKYRALAELLHNLKHDEVRYEVRSEVWDEVGYEVRSEVWNEVEYDVWDEVWREVWNEVWDDARINPNRRIQ